MPRLVVLGCGTGVGKTWVSVALIRELERRGQPCLGLKPVESGLGMWMPGQAAPTSDAAALRAAGSLGPPQAAPRYGFAAPISPHLAARKDGRAIELAQIEAWVDAAEQRAAAELVESAESAESAENTAGFWTVIETAGGVFSPLSVTETNYDLALRLEPAAWLLVAADSLGVLHDVSATWQAMAARGRTPDHLLLSQAREPDASTGSNAHELSLLGRAPSAVLKRDDAAGCTQLIDTLLRG